MLFSNHAVAVYPCRTDVVECTPMLIGGTRLMEDAEFTKFQTVAVRKMNMLVGMALNLTTSTAG